MHVLLWLFLALLLEDSSAKVMDTCVCGRSNTNFGTRIVGGKETAPHQYPWMVVLGILPDLMFCGGSLISNLHVLTAAHCPYHDPTLDPLQKHVKVGAHNYKSSGNWIPIEKIYLHNYFEVLPMHDEQDMAIYKLAWPVEFSANVLPICLPTEPKRYDGTHAIISGWGHTAERGNPSDVLLESKVTVMNETDCAAHQLIGPMFRGKSMMCGYAPNKDACQGDSGGPMFYESKVNRFEQIGVVSFGIGCGTTNPAIYTKVSTSLPWIHHIIRKDGADVCSDPEHLTPQESNEDYDYYDYYASH